MSPSERLLCRLDHIPDGGTVAVEDVPLADGPDSVIVFRAGGTVRAWLNVCPHAGQRLDWSPGQFLLSKGLLVCASHGASFQTSDGLCVGGPCRGEHLRAVPVVVRGGDVFLACNDGSGQSPTVP